MNMKFKYLAAITMAMGLFSCSNDEGLDNTTPGGQGILGNAETYATIRIAMPGGADAMGRALTKTDPETGDELEVGSENENKFHDITLYFFDGYDKTSTCKGVLTMENSKFNPQQVEGKNVVYTTNAPIKVGIEGQNMRVYAVMNGSVSGAGQGITLEKFLEKTVNTDAVFNKENTKFLMTSRTPDEFSLSSADNNTADKAASLEVSVERTAAKICYKAQNATNTYSVLNEKDQTEVASVILNEYKLVNLRNDAYYFRKVAGADGNWQSAPDFGSGVQETGNYVIDPYFTMKTVTETESPDFFTNWFGEGKAYADNSTEYQTLSTETKEHETLAYCMENTTTQDAQLNGYSTSIIFKATYTPKQVYVLNQEENKFEAQKYDTGSNFYRYGNVLYKDKEQVKKFYGLTDEKLIETFTGDTQTGGATCYYKYWIRHMDNDNAEQMGIMEFAIVRNNAYKLDVKAVSGLGEPTDEIDPNIPDESSKMYLNVKVTIMPWVVRNNNDIIL